MMNIDPKQIAELEAWLNSKGQTLAGRIGTGDPYAQFWYLTREMQLEGVTSGFVPRR